MSYTFSSCIIQQGKINSILIQSIAVPIPAILPYKVIRALSMPEHCREALEGLQDSHKKVREALDTSTQEEL